MRRAAKVLRRWTKAVRCLALLLALFFAVGPGFLLVTPRLPSCCAQKQIPPCCASENLHHAVELRSDCCQRVAVKALDLVPLSVQDWHAPLSFSWHLTAVVRLAPMLAAPLAAPLVATQQTGPPIGPPRYLAFSSYRC